MGVSFSYVIRHHFYDTHDKEKSLAFAKETLEQIRNNYFYNEIGDDCEINQCPAGDCFETSIDFECFIFRLHNGFWDIWTPYFRFYDIIRHYGDYIPVRCFGFDLAKALGQKELWYACEFKTYNGPSGEAWDTDFECWHNYLKQEFKDGIPEYNQAEVLSHIDEREMVCEDVYHDSLKDCFEQYDSIKDKIEGYRLLGLVQVNKDCLRYEKEGKIYCISQRFLCSQPNEPIEISEWTKEGYKSITPIPQIPIPDVVVKEFEKLT